MIKNRNVAFGLYVVVFMIIWNLLDIVYSAVITRSAYQFSGGTDLGLPLVAALVTGYLFFLRGKSE